MYGMQATACSSSGGRHLAPPLPAQEDALLPGLWGLPSQPLVGALGLPQARGGQGALADQLLQERGHGGLGPDPQLPPVRVQRLWWGWGWAVRKGVGMGGGDGGCRGAGVGMGWGGQQGWAGWGQLGWAWWAVRCPWGLGRRLTRVEQPALACALLMSVPNVCGKMRSSFVATATSDYRSGRAGTGWVAKLGWGRGWGLCEGSITREPAMGGALSPPQI